MDMMPEVGISRMSGVTIHPSAVVDPAAVLGRDVRIGPFCIVGPDVALDDGCELVSHVVVDGHTRIGAGVTIFPFCTVGLPPQDLKYRGEPTRCEIGPRTQLREHCTVHRGTATGRGITSVGADCLLMAVAHVAHDCHLGDNVIVANNVVMGGHVTIDDYAVIGGATAIHQFVRIGRGAMIGGVTGVASDVIPFGFVFGNRGYLTALNVIGLKRRGFDKAAIATLHRAFQTIFKDEEGTFAQRLERVRAGFGHQSLVGEMLAFIDASGPRGLTLAESRVSRDASASSNSE